MHEPLLLNRQVLVKVSPGVNSVPSGTVTSTTNAARSHGIDCVAVAVGNGVLLGAKVAVGALGVLVAVGCVLVEPESSWAVNVIAAEVCTISNSESVAVGVGLPDGRLHPLTKAAAPIKVMAIINLLFIFKLLMHILSYA